MGRAARTAAPLALVTGAGRGIGRATAEASAAEGYRIVPLAWKTGVSREERKRLIRPETVARVIVDLATGRRKERSGAAVEVRR